MADIAQAQPAGLEDQRPGHGHAHSPNLAHHFDTAAQQFDASKLGMWLFLATEVLFFSGLFCAYVIYRRNHPEIFHAGHVYLNPLLGGLNTVVLILSSFTMALGVWCAQRSKRIGLIICLALTLAGALTFMVVKFFEYKHKIEHGYNWGRYFNPHDHAATDHGHSVAAVFGETSGEHGPETRMLTGPGAHAPSATQEQQPAAEGGPKIEKSTIAPAQAGPSGLTVSATNGGPADDPHDTLAKNLHIFFSIYYGMTGLHGLHVVGGIVVLTALLILAIKGRYSAEYYTPVDLAGLYWHLVDLVWIYLFPMLYLIE